MAIPKGIWDELGLAEGWFDVTQKPVGWFDADLLDTSASSVTATLAVTEASDTVSAAADIAVASSLAVTETSDTASAAAPVAVDATLAVTESDDSLSSAATVSGGDVTATLSVTEDSDFVSSSAEVTGSGTISVLPTGGWLTGPSRAKTREQIDAERRRLGILPPKVEKDVSRVVTAVSKANPQATRDAMQRAAAARLAKEIGQARAAQQQYQMLLSIVLDEMEMQRQEEEAVAITMIYLLAA